ncbi:MAG: class II glutamine amidotransferase [Planctomycetota bacterium]|jgi:predicted glutamine amidotransferase
MRPYLESFAELCRASSEYQGHGWGMLSGGNGGRELYRRTRPIWQHDFAGVGSSRFLLVHARSAFRDGPVELRYNMPFVDGRYAFVFNGELHGVRIRVEGSTGAEKIFNLVRCLDRGDPGAALRDAMTVLKRRSRYIRAANMILTDGRRAWVSSYFDEQPEYFTLHVSRRADLVAVCSEPLPDDCDWSKLPNASIEELPCS